MPTNTAGASSVPVRSAASGAASERMRTTTMPSTEASRPMLARARGRNIISAWWSMVMVEAMAMQAIMEPQ
jgi:hypothetical protein